MQNVETESRTVARRTDARRIVARISLARTLTITPSSSYPHHHTLPRTLTLTHTIVYCEHVLHEQVSGGQLSNEQVSVNRRNYHLKSHMTVDYGFDSISIYLV
jgi:hypothetical protein